MCRSVSIDRAPVVLDREAWDHTIACAPSFGRMVERGVIRVRELDASASDSGLVSVTIPGIVDEETLIARVEDAIRVANEEAATEPVEPDPAVAPPVTQPRQQGGGKRRR